MYVFGNIRTSGGKIGSQILGYGAVP